MYNIDDIVNTVIHGDSHLELKKIPNESIDCIIIDPPYRYLKHKLDRPFDEALIFNELYRVLKPNSFLVIFGIGARLCRDIVMLEDIGFKCKEECVWVKESISNPQNNLLRRHESFYILSKGNKNINICYNDYFTIAYSEDNLEKLKENYRRILEELNHKEHIENIKYYLKNGIKQYKYINKEEKDKIVKISKRDCVGVNAIQCLIKGNRETTVIFTKENSVFRINREKYSYKHSTQKPLELMSRIVKLVSNENDIVLDCFAGSGSTLLGAIKNDRRYIGIEIDNEYYNVCINRIKEKQGLFYGKD